ncbi:MAG: hypothetical protein DKINENOH_01673 [bacterium]|nr:hypothetical protein [bacterium]
MLARSATKARRTSRRLGRSLVLSFAMSAPYCDTLGFPGLRAYRVHPAEPPWGMISKSGIVGGVTARCAVQPR